MYTFGYVVLCSKSVYIVQVGMCCAAQAGMCCREAGLLLVPQQQKKHTQICYRCTPKYATHAHVCWHMWVCALRTLGYGVATIRRLIKIIGLFCKRAL